MSLSRYNTGYEDAGCLLACCLEMMGIPETNNKWVSQNMFEILLNEISVFASPSLSLPWSSRRTTR